MDSTPPRVAEAWSLALAQRRFGITSPMRANVPRMSQHQANPPTLNTPNLSYRSNALSRNRPPGEGVACESLLPHDTDARRH